MSVSLDVGIVNFLETFSLAISGDHPSHREDWVLKKSLPRDLWKYQCLNQIPVTSGKSLAQTLQAHVEANWS